MTKTPNSTHGPSALQARALDEKIHHLIDLHFAESISEQEVRQEIASILYTSKVHEEVAYHKVPRHPQLARDLSDQLGELLVSRVLADPRTYSSALNLNQARANSPMGWARQFLRAAVTSELRNWQRARERNGILSRFSSTNHASLAEGESRDALSWGKPILTGADIAEVANTDRLHLVANHFEERIRGTSSKQRIHAQVEAICLAFDIRPAVRPKSAEERSVILKQLKDDPQLALRSLRAWGAIVYGTQAPEDDIDDTLLLLWDGQTEGSYNELVRLGAQVAHTIALGAVALLPRPSQLHIRQFRGSLVQTGSHSYRNAVTTLVDAFIASEFTETGPRSSLNKKRRESAKTGSLLMGTRLPHALMRVANHPESTFGNTPEKVEESIRQACARYFDLPLLISEVA